MFPTVWVLPSAWGNNYRHETKTHFMFCLRFVSGCAVRWDGGNTWTLRRSSPSVRKSALLTRFQFCEFVTRCGLTNHKWTAKIEFHSIEAGVCFSVPDANMLYNGKNSTAAILRSCQTRTCEWIEFSNPSNELYRWLPLSGGSELKINQCSPQNQKTLCSQCVTLWPLWVRALHAVVKPIVCATAFHGTARQAKVTTEEMHFRNLLRPVVPPSVVSCGPCLVAQRLLKMIPNKSEKS